MQQRTKKEKAGQNENKSKRAEEKGGKRKRPKREMAKRKRQEEDELRAPQASKQRGPSSFAWPSMAPVAKDR